jgi:hypothetical protein
MSALAAALGSGSCDAWAGPPVQPMVSATIIASTARFFGRRTVANPSDRAGSPRLPAPVARKDSGSKAGP